MKCAEAGPELVALALGQLAAGEAATVDSHLAACAPCRAELAVTRRLVGATRAAADPEPSAGAEARLLAAFRAERAHPHTDVPAPAALPRRKSRVLTMFVPLAAAASILVALVVAGRDQPAQVIDGEGMLYAAGGSGSVARALGRTLGAFRFGEGDEIASGATAFAVRLDLAPGSGQPSSGQPAAGTVEVTLAPGARLVRHTASEVELVAGSIDVSAGPLAEAFVVRTPPCRATVKGTRFTASTTEKRLVVSVHAGLVELGRDSGPSESLSAGEEGLVDAQRLLKRQSDGRHRGDGFLTPRASLSLDAARIRARLEVGEGGPVSILPFEDSEPRFLLRLKGDDGREREVKLQRAMLGAAPPAGGARTFRLAAETAYELVVEPRALGLEPGRYEARLHYMSYRARSDGAEWLGVVESEPLPFEVPAK